MVPPLSSGRRPSLDRHTELHRVAPRPEPFLMATESPLSRRLRAAALSLQATNPEPGQGGAAAPDQVPLGWLADAHGRSALGTLLVLLSTACLTPVPGVGTVLGMGLVALALAMWRGQRRVSLPSRASQWLLPASIAARLLNWLARFYEVAGGLAQVRWARAARAGRRGWGAANVALMAAIIILPLPLGNVLPALSLIVLGLGLVFRDGLMMLVSAGLAVLAVAYTATFGLVAWLWLAPWVVQGWQALQALFPS